VEKYLMTTDANQVIPKLAAIARAIPGTRRAFDQAPLTLSANDMPCTVILPGPAVMAWSEGSDEEAAEGIETRNYYCFLFVAPKGSGQEGEAFGACEPFLARARNAYASHPNLQGLGTTKVVVTGDSGIRDDLQYAGMFAYGIRLELQVAGRVRIAYADEE
jgi:hypothetical protein